MENAESVESGFCSGCRSRSTEKTPGNISTTNGIGRKFYGNADRCSSCGSVVRTLWFTFIEMPVIPLGSYRYRAVRINGRKMPKFWARKTNTRWDQILMTWAVGIIVAAVVITVMYLYEQSKGK